jgi:hypothetical protein
MSKVSLLGSFTTVTDQELSYHAEFGPENEMDANDLFRDKQFTRDIWRREGSEAGVGGLS